MARSNKHEDICCTAEHHGFRLVIAAADHPGATEERHAVTRQLFHAITVPAPQGAGTALS